MLQRLLFADIYRDGGSYGAAWETTEGEHWELFLLVRPWDDPLLRKEYDFLFPCNANEISQHEPILKGTPDDLIVTEILNDWKGRTNFEELEANATRLTEMLDRIPRRNN